MYICNKERKREQQPKVHIDGKIILKRQVYTVQQNDAIEYHNEQLPFHFNLHVSPSSP
jgi:hypothetical protein